MSAAPKDSHDSGRGGGQVVGSEPSYAQSQLDKSTSPWYVPNIDRLLIPEVRQWRHDPESAARMWEEGGRLTNTQCITKARMKTWKDTGWDGKDIEFMDDGDMVLDFVVTRVR
ncbi:uncharacterized protein PV06_00962 [Exophiala oligosperma]|uniref:Uncharacterized protein n=1 Tax=Exophiala oligosperma TaxID=215243 RepID=A0A0D2DZ36_9EURO|nr:uncharacterized protein PV06_00962 [Exophiala oligosperma]KIW48368.1 hypothetical protein PV06_00962 [Exophiala oligosperma]